MYIQVGVSYILLEYMHVQVSEIGVTIFTHCLLPKKGHFCLGHEANIAQINAFRVYPASMKKEK